MGKEEIWLQWINQWCAINALAVEMECFRGHTLLGEEMMVLGKYAC